MKLCKDCKWYLQRDREYDDLCSHDKAQIGFVREVSLCTCKIMRNFTCGFEGKLWEPRYGQDEEGVPGATGTGAIEASVRE